jgi:hypothetical protein
MKTTIKIALIVYIISRFKAVKITMIAQPQGLAIQKFFGMNQFIYGKEMCPI